MNNKRLSVLNITHPQNFENVHFDGVSRWKCSLDGGDKPAKQGKDFEYWYRDGVMHRDNDLPAVTTDVMQCWVQNGVYHRDDDKPAIIFKSGRKEWYDLGRLHRQSGPAVIDPKNGEEFWINGERST